MSSSLEQNLTNSIRRAKEKVYSYQQSVLLSSNVAEQPQRMHRSSSQHDHALVSALKTLQDKIAQLEAEKEELVRDKQNMEFRNQAGNFQRQDGQAAVLRLQLVEKDQQLKRIKTHNKELTVINKDLTTTVKRLEQQRITMQQLGTSQISKDISKINSADKQLLQVRKEEKVELEKRLEVTHQTLQKVMRELEDTKRALTEQKKTNLRWLKLYEEQAITTPNKENISIEANTPQQTHQRSPQKHYSQVLQLNRDLGEQLAKNRRKTSKLSKQLQESEERYGKLRLLVKEISQNIHKVAPPINSHLRFLLGRIDKLEHPHLHSLRSISTHSRKNVFKRTNSKQHKKSLKMQDLNSSGKKSHQRSSSKKGDRSSSKKFPSIGSSKNKSQERLRIRSLVLPLKKLPQEEKLELIEKEIVSLKRQHRNLIVRSRQQGDRSQQIDEVLQQMEEKQNLAEELRIKIASRLETPQQ